MKASQECKEFGQKTILSVPTLVYAPFCLFNIISPLMSVLVALIGRADKGFGKTEENE